MKKIILAFFTLASFSLYAQSVDDVIAKNVEALGGAAKLASLNTAIMSGNMTSSGTDFPITMTKTQLKGMRIGFEVMGTSNYQLANTEKAFAFLPIMQMPEPKEVDADKFKFTIPKLDLQGNLFNYKQKGSTAELMPNEKLDGADHFKIKLTTKQGVVINYYVDAKTYMIAKDAMVGALPTGGDAETTYSNYKKNADGYMLPYAIEIPNGPITFDKIDTNVAVDENIYKP